MLRLIAFSLINYLCTYIKYISYSHIKIPKNLNLNVPSQLNGSSSRTAPTPLYMLGC